MSKQNNVNPGQYKEAGREHQGDQVLHEINKQEYAQAKKSQEINSRIPNQDQNQAPAPGGGESDAGNTTASSNSSSGDY